MSDMIPETVSRACEIALAAAALDPRDAAAAALVRRYARLMDHAASLAAEAETLWELLDPDDITARKQLAKLELALTAQSVASDLGPKLLAALTALGCTLAGRGVKGKDAPSAADPQRAAHDEISAKRAQRKHNATAANPATG